MMNYDESQAPDEITESNEVPADAAVPEAPAKKRRGFAAMDRTKVREIASKGGVAAHRKGTAHRFSHDEARTAGRKGGLAPHRVRGRKLQSERSESDRSGAPA